MLRRWLLLCVLESAFALAIAPAQEPLSEGVGLREFPLAQPVPEKGGLFAHDVDDDGQLDFVVTSPGHVGAYDQSGTPKWVHRGEVAFWPFSAHPCAIAGDLDGDGKQEVAYLTGDQRVVIVDGLTGEPDGEVQLPKPTTAMAIANLRGLGDRDILIQYDQTHIAAVRADTGEVLWETDEYRGIEHSPFRAADLDGDGKDEVAGASIIDDDGRKMNEWDLGDSYLGMDSFVIADVIPGYPLEVVLAEQRGANSHTDVVNADEIVYHSLNPWNWEDPDKVTAGDFDPDRPGLEVFNRSSGGDGTTPRGDEEPFVNEEAPWVLDATGTTIAKYYINDHKPEWWTGHGIEGVSRIDWDGDAADELVAKERHKNGAGAIVAPLTGEFVELFPGKAMLIYAVDLEGDSREEVVTLDESGTIRIYSNTRPNPHPERPRPWDQQHYRRQKQNWNYYSP